MKAERDNMMYISISCTPDELRRVADNMEALKGDEEPGSMPVVVETIFIKPDVHVCFTPDKDWLYENQKEG